MKNDRLVFDSKIQGFIWELGVKIGYFKAILSYSKTIPPKYIKDFYILSNKKLLGYIDDFITQGNKIATSQNLSFLSPYIKIAILNGFTNFVKDVEQIRKEHRINKIELKIIYFDDYFSDIINFFKANSVNDEKYDFVTDDFNTTMENMLNFLNLSDIGRLKKKGEVRNCDLLLHFKIKKKEDLIYVCEIKNLLNFIDDGKISIQDAFLSTNRKILSNIKNISVIDTITFEAAISEEENIHNFFNKKKLSLKEYYNHIKNYMIDLQKGLQAISYLKNYTEYKNIKDFHGYVKPLIGFFDRLIKIDKTTLNEVAYLYSYKNELSYNDFFRKILKDKLPNDLIDSLLKMKINKETQLNFTEIIKGEHEFYILNKELREEHKNIIEKNFIDSKNLFLAGNAGIGKTTSILNLSHQKDNILFLYSSPRKDVNSDFVEKIQKIQNGKNDKRYIVITTNADETNLKNENLVNFSRVLFYTNDRYLKEKLLLKKVTNSRNNIIFEEFKTDRDELEKKEMKEFNGYINGYYSENRYYIKKENTNKNSISISKILLDTIKDLKIIDKDISVYFIATLQAMKYGGDKFFNELEKLSDFKEKIVFLDEITGEEGGIEVSKKVINLMENTQIIISDASLNNHQVAKSLFKQSANNDVLDSKIFISEKIKSKQSKIKEINFELNKKKFISIEVDSYPADEIKLESQIIIDKRSNRPNAKANNKIIDIVLETIEVNKKILVYVQNKNRLNQLKEKLKKINSLEEKDIIVIHSEVQAKERKRLVSEVIPEGDYKIALVSSSSSRGISYPHIDTILIDYQSFSIESGLMEAMQTVFRARGSAKNYNEIRNKKIIFFLKKEVDDIEEVYNNEYLINNLMLNIATITSLFRLSFLSRIGYFNIDKNYIPLSYFRSDFKRETLETTLESIHQLAERYADCICEKDQFRKTVLIKDKYMSINEKYIKETSTDTDIFHKYFVSIVNFNKNKIKINKDIINNYFLISSFIALKYKFIGDRGEIFQSYQKDLINFLNSIKNIAYGRNNKSDSKKIQNIIYRIEEIFKKYNNRNGDKILFTEKAEKTEYVFYPGLLYFIDNSSEISFNNNDDLNKEVIIKSLMMTNGDVLNYLFLEDKKIDNNLFLTTQEYEKVENGLKKRKMSNYLFNIAVLLY